MATPSLTKHALPGTVGDILIDVRAGGRDAPRPAVLIVHGFKGFKDWGMFPPLAERLAQAGFTAVSFNLSGSGVDDTGDFTLLDQFGRNTYSAELADLRQVADALVGGELGVPAPSSLGLLGHSRGGGMAVLQAARDQRVRALVTWSAIAAVDRWSEAAKAEWRERGRYDVVNARTGQVLPMYLEMLEDVERHRDGELDIQAAAGQVTAPWLLVHSSTDESVPFTEAERLMQAANRDAAELLRIEGAGHTFGAVHPWAGMTPELAQAMDATVRWFVRNL